MGLTTLSEEELILIEGNLATVDDNKVYNSNTGHIIDSSNGKIYEYRFDGKEWKLTSVNLTALGKALISLGTTGMAVFTLIKSGNIQEAMTLLLTYFSNEVTVVINSNGLYEITIAGVTFEQTLSGKWVPIN